MMKVKILKSFGSSVYGHRAEGTVCELPDGADWVQAGLAEVVEDPKKVTKRTRKRKATAPKKENAAQTPVKEN